MSAHINKHSYFRFVVMIGAFTLLGCSPTKQHEQETIIAQLELQPIHPGAYLKEVYRSDDTLSDSIAKNLYTSAYYLITQEFQDTFHRLASDELWYHLAGGSVTLYIVLPGGELKTVSLGKNIEKGDVYQIQIAKNSWYAAALTPDHPYALCALMMSPGFTPASFTLGNRETLLQLYPQHQEIIKKFTN
jgi:uncharacterized protein